MNGFSGIMKVILLDKQTVFVQPTVYSLARAIISGLNTRFLMKLVN